MRRFGFPQVFWGGDGGDGGGGGGGGGADGDYDASSDFGDYSGDWGGDYDAESDYGDYSGDWGSPDASDIADDFFGDIGDVGTYDVSTDLSASSPAASLDYDLGWDVGYTVDIPGAPSSAMDWMDLGPDFRGMDNVVGWGLPNELGKGYSDPYGLGYSIDTARGWGALENTSLGMNAPAPPGWESVDPLATSFADRGSPGFGLAAAQSPGGDPWGFTDRGANAWAPSPAPATTFADRMGATKDTTHAIGAEQYASPGTNAFPGTHSTPPDFSWATVRGPMEQPMTEWANVPTAQPSQGWGIAGPPTTAITVNARGAPEAPVAEPPTAGPPVAGPAVAAPAPTVTPPAATTTAGRSDVDVMGAPAVNPNTTEPTSVAELIESFGDALPPSRRVERSKPYEVSPGVWFSDTHGYVSAFSPEVLAVMAQRASGMAALGGRATRQAMSAVRRFNRGGRVK